MSDSTPVARITLTAGVHLDHDAGLDTPATFEPSHDYLVIREADVVDIEVLDPGPLALALFDGFEDPDPDCLVLDVVRGAVLASAASEENDEDGTNDPDPRRSFGLLHLLWHVVKRGHSVRVNRTISVPLGASDRGWLYVCECGGVVAR